MVGSTIHLKLYLVFRDLSRRWIKTGFWRLFKFGLWDNKIRVCSEWSEKNLFFSQLIFFILNFVNALRSPVGRLEGGEWSSPSEDEGRLYPSLGEGEGADKPVPSSFLGLLLCMAWCCFKLPWNEGNYAKILTRGLNSVLYITYYSLTPHRHTVLE